MILSGVKKEEYREIKPLYIKKLVDKDLFKYYDASDFLQWLKNAPEGVTLNHVINEFDTVTFLNGMKKLTPTIVLEWKGIIIGGAVPEWSDNMQGEMFVISLGNIISTKNLHNQ